MKMLTTWIDSIPEPDPRTVLLPAPRHWRGVWTSRKRFDMFPSHKSSSFTFRTSRLFLGFVYHYHAICIWVVLLAGLLNTPPIFGGSGKSTTRSYRKMQFEPVRTVRSPANPVDHPEHPHTHPIHFRDVQNLNSDYFCSKLHLYTLNIHRSWQMAAFKVFKIFRSLFYTSLPHIYLCEHKPYFWFKNIA